jgi:hypothetical protein
MRHFLMAAVVLMLSQVAAQSGTAQGASPAGSPQVADAVARADKAIAELQTTLVGRLKAELGKGGPKAAVSVCRDEAQQLTTSVGAKYQLEIGRTSHLVRNPANAPRSWTTAWVASYAGTKVADAVPAVFELRGGAVGVLRPIGTMELCVMCHGPRDTVQASIGEVLKASYPDDRAVGFAPGDLRGWFWAEVK